MESDGISLEAHAAEALDHAVPGSCHICQVETVFGIVLHVVQIKTCGRHEVIVRLFLLSDLARQDGENCHGKAGIMRSYTIVEGEVLLFLFFGIESAELHHGQNQVCLLADHVTVNGKTVIMDEQRALVSGNALQRPGLAHQEIIILRVNAALRSRIVHQVCSLLPVCGLFRFVSNRLAEALVLLRALLLQQMYEFCGVAQCFCRDAVGVSIVIDKNIVLIRTGYAVDNKAAVLRLTEEAKIVEETGCLNKHLRTALCHEIHIQCRIVVLRNSMRDIAVNMVLCRSCGEISAALLAINGSPGIESAFLMTELPCAGAGIRENGIAVFQKSAGDFRLCMQKYRQNISFGIPEIMAFISLSGKTLRAHAAQAVSSCRLQNVEKVETQTLQKCVVTLD